MKIGGIIVAAFLGLLLLLAAGCGGGDDGEKATVPAPKPTTPAAKPTTPAVQPTTPAATGGGPAVTLTITTPDNELKYDTDRMEVKAGQTVTIKYINNSTVFPHQWVLVQPGTKDAVAGRGLPAGLDNDYVEPGDEDVIAKMKLINAGGDGRDYLPGTGGRELRVRVYLPGA